MKQVLGFIFLCASINIPSVFARSYKAAVIEYAPTGNVFTQTPAQVLGQNLNNYNQFINQAALQDVDIIVFPEYGLTTLTLSSLSRLSARPFLQEFSSINSSAPQSLCDTGTAVDSQLVFTALSCYARLNAIYVVANVGEIVKCSAGQNTTENEVCPDDGAFQYSSDIVFDRNGQLVARKTHLFLEPLFQSPVVPDLAVFSTDFGINFGLMTCFDIMFYEPALTLYYQKGITDFVFPTAWVDELPFLTAVQKQEGWARFLGVNLLASNYHLPANGQIGSGIYSLSGAINYTSTPDSGSFMVVAQVGNNKEIACAKFHEEKSHSPVDSINSNRLSTRWMEPHGMLYEDLTNYSNMELKTDVADTAVLCHDDLCCQLNYSIACPTNGSCNQYRLFTYSGFRTLGGGMYTVFIQLCGVVACSDQNVQTCAKPTVTQIAQIDDLELAGNFSSAHQVYPTAVTKELQLLPVGSLQLNIYDGGGVGLAAAHSLSNTLAIGLYGRAYDKDINGKYTSIK